MTHHDLKTVQPYFDAVYSGAKRFEIRKDDRGGFITGDTLTLREWDGRRYTGRAITASVTFVTDFAQQPGFVVIGIDASTRTAHTPAAGEDDA